MLLKSFGKNVNLNLFAIQSDFLVQRPGDCLK